MEGHGMNAIGVWPFSATVPSGPAADAGAYQCWDDKLNQTLADACRTGGALCQPANVAKLLDLDYCPGTCTPKPGQLTTAQVVFGLGAIAIVGVLWWKASIRPR